MDICIKGARAICHAVGENPKLINHLVERLGLPAWRRGGAGSWRALPEDLKRWMLAQRNSHLGGLHAPDGTLDPDGQADAASQAPASTPGLEASGCAAPVPAASAVGARAAAACETPATSPGLTPGPGPDRRPGKAGAAGRQHPLPVAVAQGRGAGPPAGLAAGLSTGPHRPGP